MSNIRNNPYSSPSDHASANGPGRPGSRPVSSGKILAPGIVLVVVSVIGIAACVFSIVQALSPVLPADPELPDWMNDLESGQHGTFAAVIQGGFLLLNLLILFGGIQIIRVRTWGLCLTASILAIVNLGSCCCILGAPVGIWSIVILASSDVKETFLASKEGSS